MISKKIENMVLECLSNAPMYFTGIYKQNAIESKGSFEELKTHFLKASKYAPFTPMMGGR